MDISQKTIEKLGYKVGSDIGIYLKDNTSLNTDGDKPKFYSAHPTSSDKTFTNLVAKGYICDFLENGIEISPVWNPHVFNSHPLIIPKAANFIVEYGAMSTVFTPGENKGPDARL